MPKISPLKSGSGTRRAAASKARCPASGLGVERGRARRATNATNGPTSSAPSVRSAALRQPSSFQPPTPKSCHCIWPRSVVRSLQAATPLWSSTVRAITSPRISPSPTTSPSSPLPPYAPELNPIENVWEYLRGNKLAITVFDSYDDILDKSDSAEKDVLHGRLIRRFVLS